MLLLLSGLPRAREPLLRRGYPNEPMHKGFPDGGAARDPVSKAASAPNQDDGRYLLSQVIASRCCVGATPTSPHTKATPKVVWPATPCPKRQMPQTKKMDASVLSQVIASRCCVGATPTSPHTKATPKVVRPAPPCKCPKPKRWTLLVEPIDREPLLLLQLLFVCFICFTMDERGQAVRLHCSCLWRSGAFPKIL